MRTQPQPKPKRVISGTAGNRAYAVVPVPETGEYLAGIGWKDDQGKKHIVTVPATTPGGALALVRWMLEQAKEQL